MIKTGEEPTFITPPLEVPAEVQPRRIQARARVRPNEGGRAGGGGRARGRARGFLELAEEENDEDQDEEEPGIAAQGAMVRNPMHPGEGGKDDWRETLRNNKRNMEIYKRDKCHAWAFIIQHNDESIEDKLVVMNDYDVH